jgi:hypothetical protein
LGLTEKPRKDRHLFNVAAPAFDRAATGHDGRPDKPPAATLPALAIPVPAVGAAVIERDNRGGHRRR